MRDVDPVLETCTRSDGHSPSSIMRRQALKTCRACRSSEATVMHLPAFLLAGEQPVEREDSGQPGLAVAPT